MSILFSQVQSLTLALKPWEIQYNASIYCLCSSTSQSPYIFRFTHHHLNRFSFISYQTTSYPLFTLYLVILSTWSKSRQGSVFSTASPDARFIALELYSFSLLQNGFPYPSFRMSGFLATTDLLVISKRFSFSHFSLPYHYNHSLIFAKSWFSPYCLLISIILLYS